MFRNVRFSPLAPLECLVNLTCLDSIGIFGYFIRDPHYSLWVGLGSFPDRYVCLSHLDPLADHA